MATLNYYDKTKGEWVAIPLGGGGDSSVTEHDSVLPAPADMTPQAIEDSFQSYGDGLHYFSKSGALVSVVRQEFQTTIVINGPTRSVVRIVKSDQGLPTPQNPSTFLNSEPDGKWMKLSSAELNQPFGNPQIADLFDVPGALFDKDIRLGNVMIKSATFQEAYKFSVDNVGIGVRPVIEYSDRDQVTRIVMPSRDDVYGKVEVDGTVTAVRGEIEALKDFSIANDNNILAGLSALQEVVSNLGTVGTGQIDALTAIRGVEIEPSAIKFSDASLSPIQWKGGLSLAPVKSGTEWTLSWNDGKEVHQIITTKDYTTETILDILKNSEVEVGGQLSLASGVLTLQGDLAVGRDANRLVCQAGSAPMETLAFLSDLSNHYTKAEMDTRLADITVLAEQPMAALGQFTNTATLEAKYAKLNNPTQTVVAQGVIAQVYAFDLASGLRYMDTGEGYGKRLVLADGEDFDYVVLKSDLDGLEPIPVESSAADLSSYATKDELNAVRQEIVVNSTTAFGERYTKTEVDGLFAKKADVYTKAQTDTALTAKADKATSYTKTEVDTALTAKADKATSYTKTEVDNKLAGYLTPAAYTTLSTTAHYTKAEVDTKTSALDAKIATAMTAGSWLNATYLNGASGDLASRKVGTDCIQLQGNISLSVPTTNTWTEFATLNVNARPAKDSNFTAVAMDGMGAPSIVSIWVYASGKVTIRNYGAIGSFSINHIVASR